MAPSSPAVPAPDPAPARLDEADAVIKSWKTFSGVYKAKRLIFNKRWTKMTTARRVGIVKKHWLPLKMPSNHRPDLDNSALWRAHGVFKLAKADSFDAPDMDSLLWPYFNQETLKSPGQALVQLMESRSDLHPRLFSRLDLINPVNRKLQDAFGFTIAKPGWSEAIRLADIDSQGDSQDPDSSYGGLISVSDETNMYALLAIQVFSEQEGIRVMKVQKKIYDFLGQICEEVVQPEDTSRGKATRASARRAAKSSGEPSESAHDVIIKPVLNFEPSDPTKRKELQEYLKLHHDLDAYSHPAEVDWEYLGVLAHNQLRISEDRLRSLKEDPRRFLEYMVSVRDHSRYMLHYYHSGKRDPLVAKGTDLGNTERCAQHIKTAFSTLTDAVDTWQAIFTLIEKLRGMRNDYDGPHVDLLENSDDYAASILSIMRIGTHYKSNSSDLLQAIRCSENMRKYFRINDHNHAIEPWGTGQPKSIEGRDLYALASTLSDDNTRDIFTEWTLFEEIYALLRDNDQVSNPYLMSLAEDLNSLSSVMLVLERVWHSTRRYDLDVNAFDLIYGAIDYTVPSQKLRDLDVLVATGVLQTLVHGHLKRPLIDSFVYKKSDRMARRDYEASKAAVANLADFWDAAEATLSRAGALSQAVRELLDTAQPLTVSRPDHPDTSTKKTTKSSAKDTTASETPSAFTTGSNEPQRITFEERRVKEKTRPAVALTLHEPPNPAALPAPAVYPDIQLPLEHYNTIQMLMGPVTEALPGTVPWNAVVSCLVAIGFSYNTGHGSARIFEPSEALMASQVSDILSIFFHLPNVAYFAESVCIFLGHQHTSLTA